MTLDHRIKRAIVMDTLIAEMHDRAKLSEALIADMKATWEIIKRLPRRADYRITRYPYHFDMPPSPNESRQVRRARQRKYGA